MDFANKIVLVTGASMGNGRSIAQQFAETGLPIVIHCNSNTTGVISTTALYTQALEVILGYEMGKRVIPLDPSCLWEMVQVER